MDFFNVIFISSENSVVKYMYHLPGYSVLKSYRLSEPENSRISAYYSSLGIEDATFLTEHIGLNFGYAQEILMDKCTSRTKLRCKL